MTRLARGGQLAASEAGWEASRALVLSFRASVRPAQRRAPAKQAGAKKPAAERPSGAKRTLERSAGEDKAPKEPKRKRAAAAAPAAAPPPSLQPVAAVLALLQRLARSPQGLGDVGQAGADAATEVLRFRASATAAATAGRAKEARAMPMPEPVDGEAVPSELTARERAEQRTIGQLSVQDAALRTLRLAAPQSPPPRGAARTQKRAAAPRGGGGAADRRKRKAASESADDGSDASSAEEEEEEEEEEAAAHGAQLLEAVRKFQGADGSMLFGKGLSTHYEKRGLEARGVARVRVLRCASTRMPHRR
jgi:hypothetical protein